MTLEKVPKIEEKLKNDRRNLVNVNPSKGKSESLQLMGYFCRKYVMFELKKIQRSCVVKNDLWFQK